MSPYVVRHEPALEVDDPSGAIFEPDAEVFCEICFAAKDARLPEIHHGSPKPCFRRLRFADAGSIDARSKVQTADPVNLFCSAADKAWQCG